MPMKNAEPYIEECIRSIQSQTYQNWELIITNDHSTDNSFQIVQQFAGRDKRIKVRNNSGKGIIDALRLAYSGSKGFYITRMDADDIMPPKKLEWMQYVLKENPEVVTTGKIKYIGENLKEGYQKYETWMNELMTNKSHYDQIYRECVIPSPAWMMTRNIFDKIGGFNPNTYPEDYDLTLRIYEAKIPIEPVEDVVHIWRDYQERTSRNDPNYAFNAFEALKTTYFLKTDFNANQTLVLWGGGKKGKNIAALLLKHNINFTWACNNQKKINQTIYGQNMFDIEHVFLPNQNYQSIIAVANPEDQIDIKQQLKQLPNVTPYWFC